MLKKSIIYIVVVYVLQVISIALNILLIRNLSLENLGQVSLAKVYFQFMDYLHLGTRFTMDRYLPTSNIDDSKLILNFTLLLSLLTSFIFIVIIYIFMDANWIIMMFMISGFVFAQGTIYKAYYRAKGKIKDMIYVVLLTTMLPLVVQLIAIIFYDFVTFLFSFFFSYVISFLLLIYKFKLITFISLSSFILKFKELYKASALLFINSLTVFLSFSVDKILVEHFKGVELLGEYSIILFVFATLLIIPGSLAELVFPKIIKNVIASKKIIHFKETAFIFLPTLLSVIVANILMDYFISTFTNYSYLLDYLHLITWSILPYAFISIMYHTLNALDLRKAIVNINLISLFFFITYLICVLYLSTDILQALVIGRILQGILLLSIYIIYTLNYTNTLKEDI